MGTGLSHYAKSVEVQQDRLIWPDNRPASSDRSVVRDVAGPFSPEGGIRLVEGNIGRAIVKVSAVSLENQAIKAPARVFRSQEEFAEAFEAGDLTSDLVAVLTGQGPRANGMPELHKLSTYLGLMQSKGLKVAMVTDGRMSGASGKILAAIQVTPEAIVGGMISRIQDGDLITVDAKRNKLSVEADLASRHSPDYAHNNIGMGRELFTPMRAQASSAEEGASFILR